MTFTPGWTPRHAEVARAAAAAAGVRLVRPATPRAPLRKAYSLTKYRAGRLEQGQVGTCHEHAATRHAQVWLKAHRGMDIAPCRNLVGWAGMQIMGGGNPANGGSPTCNLRGMADGPGGVGVAHENLWPYSPDYRSCGASPTQSVLSDAAKEHFKGTALITPDPTFEAIAALIDADHGVANGQWWPAAFDTQGGMIFDSFGGGEFGHALYICGYAQAGVLHKDPCLQFDNWHTELYRVLPPELASQVEGYAPTSPDRTADYWATWPAYQRILQYTGQNAEHVTVTDADGLAQLTLADALSE